MEANFQSGLFALAGTLIGGLITYATARVGHRWEAARRDIRRLAQQVSAFYQLEQLYKEKLASLDPDKRGAKTILEDMRSQVERAGVSERPSMTSLQAIKLLKEWE